MKKEFTMAMIAEVKEDIVSIEPYATVMAQLNPDAKPLENGMNYYQNGINNIGEIYDRATKDESFETTLQYIFGEDVPFKETWIPETCWKASYVASRIAGMGMTTPEKMVDEILDQFPSCVGAGIIHSIYVNNNGYCMPLAKAYKECRHALVKYEDDIALGFMEGFILHATMVI